MDSKETTLIRVGKDIWKVLNQQKDVGDTFDDVIRRALGLTEDGGSE